MEGGNSVNTTNVQQRNNKLSDVRTILKLYVARTLDKKKHQSMNCHPFMFLEINAFTKIRHPLVAQENKIPFSYHCLI
jgi:hypothetical protein